MSDLLQRLNEKNVRDYIDESKFQTVFDLGQYETISRIQTIGPVEVGATFEQKYSYVTGKYSNSSKIGANFDIGKRTVGVATDGSSLEVNGSIGPLGASFDTTGKLEGTVGAPVAPGVNAGFFGSFNFFSALWNGAMYGAALDKALTESITAETLNHSINRCFVKGTEIVASDNTTLRIEDVAVDTKILAFDPYIESGRSTLVPKKIVRTFTNITEEWLRLTWSENGETKELVTTPSHQFLTTHGGFREIERLVAGGKGRVVLADGSEAEVTAERIVYSAETADMFEQAEGYVTPEIGNLALKPVYKKGWKTYNFEVEDFHTYVAGNARVHNHSWNDGKGIEYAGGKNAYALLDFQSPVRIDANDYVNRLIELEGRPGAEPQAHARAAAAAYSMSKAGASGKAITETFNREFHKYGRSTHNPRDFSRAEAEAKLNRDMGARDAEKEKGSGNPDAGGRSSYDGQGGSSSSSTIGDHEQGTCFAAGTLIMMADGSQKPIEQTLNISQKLTCTLLGGKVALRLVQAVRHWAKTRSCAHLMVHVTNGENADDADRFFRRCGMVTVGGNYHGHF